MPKKIDGETQQFMADLERSLQEALAGEGRVTTGDAIAKRTGGRPRQVAHKRPTTLRLEEDVLARWRASGKGWQTRAAEVLAKHAP